MNPSLQDDPWLIWQLADSAFPTGGFAHSGGLEAAWQCGEIPDTAALSAFLEAALQQCVSGLIPFVAAGWNDPCDLPALNEQCHAFLSNVVANRASRAQGQAMASSVERIFGLRLGHGSPRFHLAPVFGGCARRLGLSENAALELFLFQNLRGWLAAAVRLGVVGPMEAQSLQSRLAPAARQMLHVAPLPTLVEIANTAPLLEIWQGGQDRLYSRLFQS